MSGSPRLGRTARPTRPTGSASFIVGTGGAPLYSIQEPFAPNSTVRNDSTHGVLRLTLQPDGYAWEFLPVRSDTFTDDGAGGVPRASSALARA